MKRLVHYIPEIKGCYGPRLWIDQADVELINFVKLICLWGGPIENSVTLNQQLGLYELPLGTFENTLWQLAVSRLEICFTKS
jgi:hypothetical protein